MQNLVCRHISSRLLNESERSVEFLSWLQVSTSIKTIFTLGIESNGEDSLWLFAALQDSVTVSDEVLWDMSKCSVMSTRIADWRSSSCISGFLYLEEDDSVIVSLASGEIFRIPRLVHHHSSNDARFVPLQEFGQVETIGIFPQGVHCMQLSPDGEILCLLTGTSPTQVVFMAAEDWTILSQQDLGSLEDTRESLQLKSSSSNVPPSEWNIAWRSDGALVSITYPLNGSSNKIQMQVFRRERFTLESSCEHVWESNSCCIDWQPRVGGSIAVNLSNESIIRFYETNGLALRRLYLDAEIYCKQLQWSEQYSILVCGNSSHIRIFYHSNYHWYLKQEWIFSEFGEIAAFRIVQDRVVADRNFLYVLTTHGKLFCFMFQWQFDVFKSGEDECYLAAIDGNEIAITYLSRQIIPAPLCSFVLVCSCCIQRLEMDNKGGCLVLLSNGAMEYFSYSIIKKATCESHRVTCTKGRQLENNLDHIFKENKRETCHAGYLLPIHIEQKRELVWKAFAVSPERSSHDDMSLRILVIGERLRMYACSLEQDKWDCDLEFLKDYAKEESIWLDMQLMTMPKGDFDSQRLVICCSENYITFRDIEKLFDESEHWKVSLQTLGLTYHQILHLKSTNVMKLESNSRTECHYIVMFFLDTQGRLWTTIQPISASHSLNSACHFLLLSEDCVDFEVVTEFLFFTTRFHKLYTFPIDFILDSFLENISGTEVYRKIEWNENKLDCRPIDRFSRIVTFVTDRTAKRNNCLILQAPRGNLESVVPRLVIQRIVEQHIHNAAYGEAYR